MELTEELIRKVLNSRWNDVFKHPLMLCDKCGHYGSKMHQGVWCSRCPGKLTPRNYVIKHAMANYSKYGWGIHNSFWHQMKAMAADISSWDEENATKRYFAGADLVHKNYKWIQDIIKDEMSRQ